MFRRRRLLLCLAVIAGFVWYYRSRLARENGTPVIFADEDGEIRLRPRKPKFAVKKYITFPQEKAQDIPQIQFDFSKHPESEARKKVRLGRQAAVEKAFLHAWEGYKFHAFGKDEVAPISGSWRNSLGGWGLTMVGTMDFLWLLGMKTEFDMCVSVVNEIDFTQSAEDVINVFETTTRYLGGLLSAYEVSGYQYSSLLSKAKELGDVLYMSFDTPNRMPVTRWKWKKSAQGEVLEASHAVLLAELAGLTLEFTRLSQLTKDPKYFDAIERISEYLVQIQNQTRVPGLWPTVINALTLDFSYNHFTFGGMVGSAYEYLPKQYLLLGGLDPKYRSMYTTAIKAAKRFLFYRPMIPGGEDVLLSGNTGVDVTNRVGTEAQAQHLSCFTGGMVAMASKIFALPEDLSVARKLVDGCVWAYNVMPSGLMPELFHTLACHNLEPDESKPRMDRQCSWDESRWYTAVSSRHGKTKTTEKMSDVEAGKYWVKNKSLLPGFTDHPDNRYILRPEVIESLFILFRISGDKNLPEKAWNIFQAIEKATRTQIAHAGIHDVREPPESISQSDRMESFWLADTLKYFWLVFGEPDQLSLDEWVFNGEAHVFKRPKPGTKLL